MKTRYHVSRADARPLPRSFYEEPRYLGYRDSDRAKSFAKYFAGSVLPVQDHVPVAIYGQPVPSERGMRLREAADLLGRPGYLPVENGYTVNADGHLVVAVLTKMPRVTAEMWDWWMGWHSTDSSRYKLWHPDAHCFACMGEDRSHDRSMSFRQRFYDNVSYVDEYIGPQLSRLAIRFFDPADLGFQPKPGVTNIVARGGSSLLPLSFSWLIHNIRPIEDGVEMRSRFFINAIDALNVPARAVGSTAGKFLSTAGVRQIFGAVAAKAGGMETREFGPDLLHHCAQEMNHLASFLPELFDEFKDMP